LRVPFKRIGLPEILRGDEWTKEEIEMTKNNLEAQMTGLGLNKPDYIVVPRNPYNRTTFIRELTRDLFIERVRGYQGKVTGDYAQYAYQAAVAVADVLELED